MNKLRGSQFRKWDLHLHSLETNINNNYKCEEEKDKKEILLKHLKENHIEVVGLTNYFNFTSDDFDLKEYLESNGIVTFLNLEIRLSNINKDDQLGDYHIIFNNTLDKQVIENLLGELKANLGDCKLAFNRLTKQQIERSANISIETLHDTLRKNEELKNNYLTGFLSRGHGSSASDGDAKNLAVYESTTVESDFIIHSSCDNPEKCSDKRCKHNNLEKDREYWLRKSPHTKPLLQSSDAHSFEEVGSKYSWIKADKTFEGLKQILFEPESRICLDKEKPQLEKDELVIDRIDIDGKEIYLSENLNAIIGGRSTGKSTLLNTIAKKLNGIVKDDVFIFEDLANFKIFWRDQQENYDREIEYIPQEFMFMVARDESKLNELVSKIIKEKKLDGVLGIYKKSCKQVGMQVQKYLENYFSYCEQLKNLNKPEAEEDKTLKRIEEYQQKTDKILSESNFDLDDRLVFKELSDEKDSREKLNSDNEQQKKLLSTLEIQEIRLNDDIRTELKKDLSEKVSSIVTDLDSSIRKQFNEYKDELMKSLNTEINDNNERLSEIKLNPIYLKGLDISEKDTILKRLEDQLKNERKILDDIQEFSRQRTAIEIEIETTKQNICKTYKMYEELRKELENDFRIIQDDLKIKLEFKKIDLYDSFTYINGQGNSKSNFIEKLTTDFNKEIEKIFDNEDLRFNHGKEQDDLITHFFSTHFYEYDFKIVYQCDEFQMMSPGKKAFVILKLILEFSDSKIPVLIDQPEDSLDNRAIYSELTKYIKATKLQRQMIVVTHNPNIVVGSDCENIIVANQHSESTKNEKGIKFDYINGSLEDSFEKSTPYTLARQGIKEHIFEILEGGKEAFEKREKKYNMKLSK